MFENENKYIENDVFNYLMQPGDGTAYRFAIQFMPIVEKYTVSSGCDANCVWLAINMSGGTGVGVIGKSQLKYFACGEDDSLIDYLKGHGFGNVNDFTLVAVLLAVSILMVDPENVESAAIEMLKAREILMRQYNS